MIIKIPDNASRIAELLIDKGYNAYIVGGCVRDRLIGRPVGDIDITTSATPQELEKILSDNNIKYIETGIKHGTITALLDNESYEITTFRTDGDYNDNRHPETVEFVSDIATDLARRDFTMNAIAYNNYEGIVDLYGGYQDINNKVVRAVGNADKRFKEDALRIMRAIRFACVLGFDIEPATKKALFDNKDLLKNIAGERIFSELKKLLLGSNVESVLIEYRDIIAVVIPELAVCFDYPQNTKWHLYDVYTHTAKSVALCPEKDYMRLVLLLHDIGKPFCKTVDENATDHFKGHAHKSAELSADILKRFKVSNDIFKRVTVLIDKHAEYIKEEKANIKYWLKELGEEMTLDYIDVKIADLRTHNLKYSQLEIDSLYRIKDITKEIISSGEPYRISDLKINGNTLKAMGYYGSQISEMLNFLLDEVIANPSLNTKSNLIELAQNKNGKL